MEPENTPKNVSEKLPSQSAENPSVEPKNEPKKLELLIQQSFQQQNITNIQDSVFNPLFALVAEYANPGSVKQIMDMTAREQAHRHQIETADQKTRDSAVKYQYRIEISKILSGIVYFGFVFGLTYLLWQAGDKNSFSTMIKGIGTVFGTVLVLVVAGKFWGEKSSD